MLPGIDIPATEQGLPVQVIDANAPRNDNITVPVPGFRLRMLAAYLDNAGVLWHAAHDQTTGQYLVTLPRYALPIVLQVVQYVGQPQPTLPALPAVTQAQQRKFKKWWAMWMRRLKRLLWLTAVVLLVVAAVAYYLGVI